MTRFVPDKQYARDMLRAVSEGLKARNPGATTVKKRTKKQSSKAGVRKGAKKALKARKAARTPRAKKTATTTARTPVVADPRAAGSKVDVVQQIADMMERPVGHKAAPLGGASMDEMVKATGYDAHQMRAKIKLVRDRLKYTTTAPSKANGYRYFAQRPMLADAQ